MIKMIQLIINAKFAKKQKNILKISIAFVLATNNKVFMKNALRINLKRDLKLSIKTI